MLSALRPTVLVFGLAGLALQAMAQEASPGWRYGPMWDGHWGWMFIGPLMMITFVAAVVVLVVLALRWISGGGPHTAAPATKTPLDILKERFARGEIEKAEFEERRRLLQD